MKKILFLSLMAFAISAQSQTVLMQSYTKHKTVDTVGNSSVDTMVVKVAGIWTNINIQIVLTNVGARVDSAARTAKIYGSIDSINFVQIGSTTFTDANASALNTSVVGVYSYEWTPLVVDKYLYYACMVTATGNDSAQVKVYLTYKSTPYAPNVTSGVARMVSSSNSGIIDTLTTTAKKMTLIVGNPHLSVSIQPVVKKISGTPLAGVQLQYSEDGTNFFNVTGDSLHITDLSTAQTTIWNIPASSEQHQYYRVVATKYGGTESMSIKSYLLGK